MSTVPTTPSPAAKTSARAVWSLVLGVLGMTCLWLLGSIPAILLGILAVKGIDRSGGTLQGRGLGIAGIVTGSLGIFTGIGTVAMMAALLIPALSGGRMRAQQAREMSQVRQIALGCRAYAIDRNGAYPATLSALADGGYLDPQVLEADTPVGAAYLYRPGLTDASGGDEPLLASPAPLAGHRVVGMADGLVKRVEEEEFQADYAHRFPRN